MADWQINCCTCGRFMNPQTPGSSWVFVPDSYVSYEEDRWQCAGCTEKYGRLVPNQSVVVEMCSGVIPAVRTNDGYITDGSVPQAR